MEDDKLTKQFVRTIDASPASEDDSNTAIPWNEAGISKYFKAVEKFKEQLFVLVHLIAGAPARGIESVTVAYENGVDDRGYRGVFVDNGLVLFVTLYNKTGIKDEIKAKEEQADADLHLDNASGDRDHDPDDPDHDTDSNDDSEIFVEEGESIEDDTPQELAFTPSNPDRVYSTDRCRRLL
ncbi:hypothetical protein D6D13_10645 [Aureobasidium pullulans]|uniref:Uncharacterized protein n=1 Tax=Aureobasidium pullulans TaxID=5580 RepID=A0A4S9BZ56_AURPU|nr:hypothetical protein D6D13_10645 [Aureobasidium pullulans]